MPVFKEGDPLALPWTGAYNSGQFWPCDMNNDGEEDLLLYDKTSGRMLVFLAATGPLTMEMDWEKARVEKRAIRLRMRIAT